jgi:glycine dehydrogenase subunit 2
MNPQGRPTRPAGVAACAESSHLDEPLIFEQGQAGRSGVDVPAIPEHKSWLGNFRREGPIGLPGLSEPQVVRHYTRLSQQNFSIDGQFYPLGSCTMKHNPRLNEKLARLPGLADLHPLQPVSTIQGALELIDLLAYWLKTLTGMPYVALPQGAGAQGEFCGMAAIKAALAARGERRTKVLAPESAHGTNPATAAALGFTVETLPATAQGRVDLEVFKSKLGPDVAAIMLTNPNTCGLFERDVVEIARAIHAQGAYFYCDGANFNAIVGRVRPADLGVDAMHINLHKTFSTPHGGGGPGAGPVVLSEELARFAPLPWVLHGDQGFRLLEHRQDEARQSMGRLKGFHGQMGMFIRALAYMLSHGADGLRQVSGDAVLNANYVLASLKDTLSAPFDGPCMHEALFDDRFLKDSGVAMLDFAKAMLDAGFHPPTMYFPLVVHGALLVEPTETESVATLDGFIAALSRLAEQAKAGDAAFFHEAPRQTPLRRLDETQAARKPILKWTAI